MKYQFRLEIEGDEIKAGRIQKAVALLEWTDKVYFIDEDVSNTHFLETVTKDISDNSVSHYNDVLNLIDGIIGIDEVNNI